MNLLRLRFCLMISTVCFSLQFDIIGVSGRWWYKRAWVLGLVAGKVQQSLLLVIDRFIEPWYWELTGETNSVL